MHQTKNKTHTKRYVSTEKKTLLCIPVIFLNFSHYHNDQAKDLKINNCKTLSHYWCNFLNFILYQLCDFPVFCLDFGFEFNVSK